MPGKGKPFEKGRKKTGGIEKGDKHKRTEIIQSIQQLPEGAIKENLERFTTELSAMKGKQFVDTILALLEYIIPKLARVENKVEVKAMVYVWGKPKN